MFLEINGQSINLRNVSNVNVVRDRNRVVFNMNYGISIGTGNHPKTISDYVYWDASDSSELSQNMSDLINNRYFADNFLSDVNKSVFINVNEISSIKYIERKCRVIFNLSHPVSFIDHDKQERITSEFVYINCNSSSQYQEYVKYAKKFIGG